MSQYIDRREAQKSYRPVAGSMSPGLKRAREPYRAKNALVGLALGAFAVGIWAYSISAVKQDIFDDVDEEAKALSTPTSTASQNPKAALAAEQQQLLASSTNTTTTTTPATVPTSSPMTSDPVILTEVEKARQAPVARGVLQHLSHRFPQLLDPQAKTIVWGAPPVDNVGKMSKS